jgi:hypothetical protein
MQDKKISQSISSIFFGHFCVICLFIGLSLPVFSQPVKALTDKQTEQLGLLSKNSTQELVYIQTSKGIYEPLEDLWFKAYLLDSHTFAPSSLSQTLYLQLLNENTKQVVWQEKYEVQNGFVDGHVFLQDTLSVGDYFLSAYSRYSFFGDNTEMKAVRRIQIRKELKANYDGWKEPVSLSVSKKKGSIQFTTFPEGGDLVSGVHSNLAFKAVNTDAMPCDIQGTLFEDTLPLVKFKSSHAGMGSLEFTPFAGRKYQIRLSEPKTDSVFLLPLVNPEGISMRLISRDKEFLEFIVSQSSSLQKRTVYLRGQIRGVVYCIASGVLNNELRIKIPLKEFTYQGIAEFTLFTDSLIPIAERLVYVNPGKKLYIETQLNKERYETKEKATLKITVKDENGEPAAANLGVCVYDKLYQNPVDPVNILTHCYLISQIRGKIYDPAYYFDSKNEDMEEALDLLLLTQGWRRYVWSGSALKGSVKEKQQVILDGVEGELHATKNLKKAQSVQQILMAFYPGKNGNNDLIIADSAGRFMVTPEHLKTGQGSYVYFKPMMPDDYVPRISLSDPFQTINKIRKTKEMSYPLPGPIVIIKEDVPIDPYVEGHKIIKIPEITVYGHGSGVFRDKYIGQLDSVAKLNFMPNDYVCPSGYLNCPVHEHYKNNTLPVEGKLYKKYIGFKWNENGSYSPGATVTVEYHYPKFTEEELLKMNNLSRVKAYYIHREFYQPNYDKATGQELMDDFRNTLLWRPLVTSDKKGEATLEFFCSDINTRFLGSIEGVSGEGLLGIESFEFAVLKPKPIKSVK